MWGVLETHGDYWKAFHTNHKVLHYISSEPPKCSIQLHRRQAQLKKKSFKQQQLESQIYENFYQNVNKQRKNYNTTIGSAYRNRNMIMNNQEVLI